MGVPAFQFEDGEQHVRAAHTALADLSALIEQGGARLVEYPRGLPSLDELTAMVGNICTRPTLNHDQLTTFGRLAHEASIGALVDHCGAIADLSVSLPAYRSDGAAAVTSDGITVAWIARDGSRRWANDNPENAPEGAER